MSPCLAKLQGNIKYCSTSGKLSILDIDNLCSWNKSTEIPFPELDASKAIVLNKVHDEVSGRGYRCEAHRKEYIFKRSFWGVDTTTESEWAPLNIDPKTCWDMINTKRCRIDMEGGEYNNKLNCKTGEKECSIYDIPTPTFSWLDTNKMYGYICMFHETSILAENEDSSLYFDSICKVKDFSCKVKDFTLVWDKTVIHDCPYQSVSVTGNFTWVDNVVIANEIANIVLQPIKEVRICDNITAYETNEGFYITMKSEKTIKLLDTKTTSIDLVDKMMLANLDYNKAEEVKWLKFIDMQTCSNLVTTLSIATRLDNEFFEITNNKGKSAILYTRHGLIFLPECIDLDLDSITMYTQEELCYRELRVSSN